jgi:hypothetical protein
MKRNALLCLSAALLVACQDSEPTRPPEPGPISFAISDGASGGNPDFFFFPPLADDPSGHDDFDPDAFNEFLAPFVKFCHLDFPNTGDCTDLSVAEQVEFPMDLLADRELYRFIWHTSDFDLSDGENYRIEVFVGSVEVPGSRLGFRDVTALPGPPIASCTSDDEFCQINNGSTVPIKVRIEDRAFCPADRNCQTKSTDFSTDTRWEIEGNSYYALDVPTQPGENGTVTITFRECAVDDVGTLIDLPTYGPCVETDILATISEFDGSVDPNATATISFCDFLYQDWDPSPPASQINLIRLHSFHEDGSSEALREAAICPPPPPPSPLSGLLANPMLRLASRIGDRVRSWIGVRPLIASTAVQALTSRGGDAERTIRTKFKFALPAKIDFVDPADSSRIAPAGSTLGTRAVVTDILGNPVAGATVRWNVAAVGELGAEVEGNVSAPPSSTSCVDGATLSSTDDVVCTTGSSGTIEVDWKLATDPGLNILTGGGRGIADPREAFNGPRVATYPLGAFDPFVPIAYTEKENDGIESPGEELAELIPDGTRLLFSATGCEPGFGTPNSPLNGEIEPGEWDCAIQMTFPVNLSGGSTVDATLYYMNDDTHFHLAVVVPGTGRVNALRVEWDSNGSGNGDGREPGDDVWEFEPEDGAADKFIDEKCSDSGQSSCGKDDDGFGGFMDTDAAFDNSGGETVYEMSHPLSTGDMCEVLGKNKCGDSEFPIDLNRSKDDPAGFFVTLRLGSGAQGNTQWPGFLDYLMITIN